MASPLLFFVLLVSVLTINLSKSELTENYYEKTCPNFEKIMKDLITAKHQAEPRTMASALRILFHDCMVDGCDASIMLKSTNDEDTTEETELMVNFNNLLSTEGFDLANALKDALEKECPGVVSCADILAYSTRNLVELAGGPRFRVPLGRKDGRVSLKSHVEGNLPKGNSSMDEMVSMFTKYGMTMEDLVALTIGGHTAGSAHCKAFGKRIYAYNETHMNDPLMDSQYAQIMRDQCKAGALTRIQLDEVTPHKFDNLYCEQMKKSRVVFYTDQLFLLDPRTSGMVEAYAKDQKVLFDAFVKGMERLIMIGIKDEKNGEVRKRCDAVNPKDTFVPAGV